MNKKCMRFFHKWTNIPLIKGLRMRKCEEIQECMKCGHGRIKKYGKWRNNKNLISPEDMVGLKE